MQQVFHEIKLNTNGQGFYDFTDKTFDWLKKQLKTIQNKIINAINSSYWPFLSVS